MRAVTINSLGDDVSANIAVEHDWPMPSPAAGEVLVRTEASALNHLDIWVGRGLPGAADFPRISGSDGCGRIEAVGEGVDEAWIGKRVLLNAAVRHLHADHPDVKPADSALHMIGETLPGTHAEYFKAPAGNVLDIGDADPEQAAAFSLSFLTGWRMLMSRARLKADQHVLITGIGGGVALSCLAICRWLGCTTIVTSRHEWKLERARELGADHVVHDTNEDWSGLVRSITGKRGVDVCVDSIGMAVHLACLASLARGGTLVTCGATSGPGATTDLVRIFWNQLSVLGSTMGDMDEFREVVALHVSGHLQPVIDSVHTVDDAAAAWQRLESGDQFGKIVLRWD
ncbi:MAG: zinc-binding dehydrogenase [Planctomycetota bacterium]|nr:zinc-binding dehydrogenase [Planctomycetota bacterium]